MKPIIEVKNIGKKYDIRHFQGKYVALRDVLMTVLKSPFKFFKEKAKVVAGIGTHEAFWALKDVSFNIMPGEVVGVIGRNGAGKSTLLKILTGITPPTTGEIIMRGRTASLLEVGTGFHPELTGRENIFLNGAILGMPKKQIAENFDKIVEFAGVEKFLDTPVKYYSSGMYVRLAFSVAAHLEPDILLVDEVLAVGDAEFQKKCLGKMEEVTQKDGRTILFVSHNMAAIQKLCKRSILLKDGRVHAIGPTDDVMQEYMQTIKSKSILEYDTTPQDKTRHATIKRIEILNRYSKPSAQIPINENFSIKIEYQINEDVGDSLLSATFSRDNEILLVSSVSDNNGKLVDFKKGNYVTEIKIPGFLFNVGHMNCEISITKQKPFLEFIDRKQDISFEIMNINNPRANIFGGKNFGKISSILKYETKSL